MTDINILTESELRQCVVLDKQLIDIIDQAFAQLAAGDVIMPPVLSMDLPQVNGEVDVKTAYIPGLDSFAIKVSPGFFDNPLKGLPSLNGLMVTLSADTGIVKSILLDNGYLTDIRTAAAGGVSFRHLAPQNIKTAGIIGCGIQARLQAQALLIERDVTQLLVWGRDIEKAEKYASEQSDVLGIPVDVASGPQELVDQSQVVITTTPSAEPMIQADWLHPGLHITAMGSDSAEKNELDPLILNKADRFVVDRRQQSIERGEMRSAIKAGLMSSQEAVIELGELCQSKKHRRQSEQEITVCDLTGTGVQDTAIANHAVVVAKSKGFGTVLTS